MKRFSAVAVLWCVLTVSAFAAEGQQDALYVFSSTYCAPCQKMAPLVEKLQREGLPVRKVDIDQHKAFADQHQVDRIPTFLVIVGGREVERRVGEMSEGELRRLAAKTPTQPAVARPGEGGLFPIDLGAPAPLQKSLPVNTSHETRIVEGEQRKGLLDLLKFNRQDKAETESQVVRGNDVQLAYNDSPFASSSKPTSPADARPMDASVRIRVINGNGIQLGSGTVIASTEGNTQILTCAHIFRGATQDAKIEVDMFEQGRPVMAIARIVNVDQNSDLGLIAIPTSVPVPFKKVAGKDAAPRIGDPVLTIGCSGGDDPTEESVQVTDVDKYDGPHNILCTGLPVTGRSGGGLFNERGEVVGVCSAADKEMKRGFYSGLLAIHRLLDQSNLTELYQPRPAAPVQQLAVTEHPFASTPAPSASRPEASLARSSSMDVPTADAEVIVVIRDPSQPGGNHVVIIHRPSEKFMSYLSGELDAGGKNSMMSSIGNSSTTMPAVSRSERIAQAFDSIPDDFPTKGFGKHSLTPTAHAQPVTPQRYVRTTASR